jgi:hypothetical protein
MKEKYNKLENKGAFVEMISFKLGLKKQTIQHCFTVGYFPQKHIEKIENALDLQLKADEHKKNIQLKMENEL